MSTLLHKPPPELVSSYKTENLSLLNNDPPSLLPQRPATTILFSVSTTLPTPDKFVESYSTCLCDGPMSLSMTSSRFIHVVACVRMPFHRKAFENSVVCTHTYTTFCSSYPLSGDTWGTPTLLAVVDDASMNMGVPFFPLFDLHS